MTVDNDWLITEVLVEGDEKLADMGIETQNKWLSTVIKHNNIQVAQEHEEGTQILLSCGTAMVINEKYEDIIILIIK